MSGTNERACKTALGYAPGKRKASMNLESHLWWGSLRRLCGFEAQGVCNCDDGIGGRRDEFLETPGDGFIYDGRWVVGDEQNGETSPEARTDDAVTDDGLRGVWGAGFTFIMSSA